MTAAPILLIQSAMKYQSKRTAASMTLKSILCFSGLLTSLSISMVANAAPNLEERDFKLISIQISVHRVTAANRAKLVKAFDQADSNTRELISTPLGEIWAMERLNANCTAEQLDQNLSYRGLSTLRGDLSFYFKPARDVRCASLNVHELKLQPVEQKGNTLKFDVSIDRVTRRASCDIIETDGPLGIWTNTKVGCSLENGEGTFVFEVSG